MALYIIFDIYVWFMSYLKCSNWRQILKLLSNFGCLFTFCYLDGAIFDKFAQGEQYIVYKY